MTANFDAAAVARLDRLYRSPQILEQRRRFRAALAPQPGERGLDVGCGGGHLTFELAKDVAPGGRITAIDSSEDAIAACKARSEREGFAATVEIHAGAAAPLQFPDQAFDFVVATQVYCYVSEIDQALKEARRVLRNGGRLLVLDTDWDMCLYRSSDDGLTRRLIEADASRFAHRHLPRELPRLLHTAGLRLVGVQTVALIETRYDPDSFGAGLISTLVEAGRKNGIPTPELAAWEADLRSRTGEGSGSFAWTGSSLAPSAANSRQDSLAVHRSRAAMASVPIVNAPGAFPRAVHRSAPRSPAAHRSARPARR
jgi:arsenite methyltransferase